MKDESVAEDLAREIQDRNKRIVELEIQNKRYRKALEFYAVSGQGIGEEKHGEVAREALESESE